MNLSAPFLASEVVREAVRELVFLPPLGGS